ncbi:RNA polymerase sigma factor [Maledivibacter halophilus]|uniref:RNA polymerase sigma-70 factor, ECF subfamily n=1 Tax=Maledivibacter halophilus TaxID=36842 RepID=A0A1T5MJJ8_9FIRM|nr:sigma-70 family RNA polymerase sigma factor [Maledivibacter halophilus]SKC88243.1 RNA polymerase sigma-70 factor, ECF subfamily [Maledivibacter halophilus]
MKNESLENFLIDEMKIVFKYLIKIGVNKEDVEDIIQDTICKAIVNIDAIDEEKISSWLFKVSINSYYNLYNKRKRQRKKKEELRESDIVNLCNHLLTEEYVISKERKHYVHKVLSSINPSYRNLLILKYFMDLSYKEISKLIDISEGNVKTYLYRARKEFKKEWEALKYEG